MNSKVAKSSRSGALPGERRGGRKAGVPNRATRDARAAIAEFVNGNTGRMQIWLDQVALESPERAFNMLRDLIEYHVPKLARTEVTGADGANLVPQVVNITIVGV
jgi:hypothetical protein